MLGKRLLVVLTLGLTTQAFAAGCIGLPKVEKEQCLQRIIDGSVQTPEQVARERARSAGAMDALQTDLARRRQQDQIKQQVDLEMQQQRAEMQQQQQILAQQRRRDAIAEDTLYQLQQLANRPPPPVQQAPEPRRSMTCFNYGGGFSTCN